MVKPDTQVLESLARIGFSEKPLVGWIDRSLDSLKVNIMFQTDETQLRILQGRAQELNEIRELITKSPDLIRKA